MEKPERAGVPRFQPFEARMPNVEILVRKDNDIGWKVEFDRIAEGLRVTMDDTIHYRPGDDEMTLRSFTHLKKIAQAIEHMPYQIVVQTQIGSADLGALGGRNRSDLAMERALNAAERLAEALTVPITSIGVSINGIEREGRGTASVIIADYRRFWR